MTIPPRLRPALGELVSLRCGNVDLERRQVHVVEFVTAFGYDLVPSSGKSRDAVRSIELDDGLVRVMRAQRKLQAEERLAAEDYVDSDFVFTRLKGGPYHPVNLSKLLGRMTVEVGLQRLTAHGLLHTSATLMLANGVPPKVAAERLGTRSDAVHEPLQPRHADDAAGGGREDRLSVAGRTGATSGR